MIHKVAIVALLPLLACPLAHADSGVGTAICQDLATDPSAGTVMADLDVLIHQGGLDAYSAGFVIGRSVRTYCPQFEYVLSEYLNAHPAPIVRV